MALPYGQRRERCFPIPRHPCGVFQQQLARRLGIPEGFRLVPEARQAQFHAELVSALVETDGKVESGYGIHSGSIAFPAPLYLQQSDVEPGMSIHIAAKGFMEALQRRIG
jgi:hypothetical protein